MNNDQDLVMEKLLLIFKEANENYDGSLITDYLAENVIYTSNGVLEDLTGKEKVSHYLIGRYKFFETHKDSQRRLLEKGYVTGPWHNNSPCLILSVNGSRGGFIYFDINEKDQIKLISTITIPLDNSLKTVEKFKCEIEDLVLDDVENEMNCIIINNEQDK